MSFYEMEQELSCKQMEIESLRQQLAEAYEAGKRDATPEGYALVPKQPTLLMLRATYLCESITEAYKAMIAAAPERRRMMTLVELLQQAASESDTPNTSIEGKAANLIERQAAQIESLRQQLAAAIAACKLKDEALQQEYDYQKANDIEIAFWIEEALATLPDDSALRAWLGGPVGEVKKHTGSLKDMAIIVWSGEQPAEGTKLYSPKGLK